MIDKQNFAIANCTSSWTFNVQSLLDSDKYLLSFSTLINPLESDVHHMMSQILSILIDFYPDLCAIFSIIFPIFKPSIHNFGTRKDIMLASVSFWPLLIIKLVPCSVPARLIIR